MQYGRLQGTTAAFSQWLHPGETFCFLQGDKNEKSAFSKLLSDKKIQNLLLHSDVIDREMVLITQQLLQNAPQQMVHLIINPAPTATAQPKEHVLCKLRHLGTRLSNNFLKGNPTDGRLDSTRDRQASFNFNLMMIKTGERANGQQHN